MKPGSFRETAGAGSSGGDHGRPPSSKRLGTGCHRHRGEGPRREYRRGELTVLGVEAVPLDSEREALALLYLTELLVPLFGPDAGA
jgi:hypothetical protein